MKAVSRFIAAHNFLPIVISFICYRHFSASKNHETDYFLAFGASFFCWLFYWLDKIKDNKTQIFATSDRHYLSNTDKVIQWMMGLILASLTLINFHKIPIKQLLVFASVIPVCLVYLLIANTRKNFLKEIFSSLIISYSLCLLPVLINGEIKNLSAFPVFFLMVLGNMVLLGIIERDYDLQHGFNSLSVNFSKRFMINAFISLLAILMVLTLAISPENILWVCVYCSTYLILLISRRCFSLEILHILSDCVFLFPLI